MPENPNQFVDDIPKQTRLLPMLLKAYDTINEGVPEAIKREEKQGRQLACHKACAVCHRAHKDIPVCPLELVGIRWYLTEKTSGKQCQILNQQLRNHQDGDAYPFLVENACAIHIMRPITSHQFNVFGKVCAVGEDAYHPRRKVVFNPVIKYTDIAFDITLPFNGIANKAHRKKVIENGAIHQTVKVVQNCNWQSLAQKLDDHEQSNPELIDNDED